MTNDSLRLPCVVTHRDPLIPIMSELIAMKPRDEWLLRVKVAPNLGEHNGEVFNQIKG